MLMEIISIVGGILFIVLGACSGGDELFDFAWLVDLPTLIIMAVFVVPILLRNGLWQDFKRAFRLHKKGFTCHLSELRRTEDVIVMLQKQVQYAGMLTALISCIYVLINISDPSMLGPNVAVAVLSLIYTVILEMLLLPLHLTVKSRIINYMGMEPVPETEGILAEDEGARPAEAAKKTEEM